MSDEPPPRKRPGPKPNPEKTRHAMTMIRSRKAWKQAVEEAAAHDHARSVADFIDRALAAYLRQIGFPKGLPRR